LEGAGAAAGIESFFSMPAFKPIAYTDSVAHP
jgi:hypothetical protein